MFSIIKFTIGVSLICFIADLSNAAFVDTLSKCSIKDNACQAKLMKNAIQQIGKTGIPEHNIPPIDPIHLEDVTVSVLNLLNITLVDGVAKGIKDCEFVTFELDIETKRGKQGILCNLLIKGHYRLTAASPLIESLLGGSEIHGEGKGKVKIDKLLLEMDFPFYLRKKSDGEIYIECDNNKTGHKFDILGKTTFAADNIYLGKEDVSKFIVDYLNENSQFIMKTFGQIFVDKGIEFYNRFKSYFFDYVPAKHYISDDLTPYLED